MSWEALPKPRRGERDTGWTIKKARYLVDRNIEDAVVPIIHHLGWKAIGVSEVGLAAQEDENVLAYAYRYDLVLVTQDKDFADRRRFPVHRNPGIIVLPGGTVSDATVSALAHAVSIVGWYRDRYRGAWVTVGGDNVFSVTEHDSEVGRIVTRQFRETSKGQLEMRTLIATQRADSLASP